MTARASKKGAKLSVEEIRVLREFARGYLHEDFSHEHGHAIGAGTAFAGDAGSDERDRVAAALDRAADLFADRSAADLKKLFVKDLRAAWTPESASDLRAIAEAIRPHAH